MREPYLWRDGWYIKVTGRNGKRSQKKLGNTKQEAYDAWHEMKAVASASAPTSSLLAIGSAFQRWCDHNKSQSSAYWYASYLGPFLETHGRLTAAQLKPFHLTEWLDQRGYTPGARRAAIGAVKRMLYWAVDEGRIQFNPLARYRKPPAGRRNQLISPETHRLMLAVLDGNRGGRGVNRRTGETKRPRDSAFRLFLIALQWTGARPQEVAAVEAKNFSERAEAWVLPKHKTAEITDRPRVIRLPPCMLTLTRILAHHRPDGKLFRNSDGEAWTGSAVNSRMKRLRKKLGLPEGTVAYAYRHTWTTRALVNGVPTASVAALLGHQDTSMIDRHYGHLDQCQDHLKQAMMRAVSSTPKE